MTDNTKDTPVTFEMLLDAIDGCGEAFGQALHIALAESGADHSQRLRIARRLSDAAENDFTTGPNAHCITGIVTGFLARFPKV